MLGQLSSHNETLSTVAEWAFFSVSFLLPIIAARVVAARYEPLYDELLKYRGQLKKLHKSLEDAREKEASIRRRCESLLAKEDLYELETAADIERFSLCGRTERRYDIASWRIWGTRCDVGGRGYVSRSGSRGHHS